MDPLPAIAGNKKMVKNNLVNGSVLVKNRAITLPGLLDPVLFVGIRIFDILILLKHKGFISIGLIF
jgi:hypothetical protein